MVSEKRSQVKGHLGQGHEIFRVGVKLINVRVLKVSSRSAAFYASYSQKIEGGPFDSPLYGRGLPPSCWGALNAPTFFAGPYQKTARHRRAKFWVPVGN